MNILRELSHPNIIKLYEVYETENSIYLVLELIEGCELYEVIQDKNQIFNDKDTQNIMKSILKCVEYMHSM